MSTSIIRERLRMLSEVFRNINDSVYICDLEDNVILVNQAFTKVYGYTAEEIIGRPSRLLWDQGAKENDIRRSLPNKLEGVWIFNFRKDGSKLPVFLSRSVIYEDNGKELAVISVTRDVTELQKTREELQESETRFRQLAESIAQVFWLVDVETKQVIYLSQQYEKVWGSPRSLHNNTFDELFSSIHPEDIDQITTSLEPRMAGDYDREYRIIRSDGTCSWVRERAFPIKNASGNTYRVSGIIEDITSIKEAEEKKSQLEEQLRHSQKMEAIGALAGGIAHDFNNILGSIIGYAELSIQDSPQGTTLQQNVQEILTAAQRAKSLVEQILTFSRRSARACVPIDFTSIVNEVLRLIRVTLPSTIEILPPREEIKRGIIGDPAQIHAMLMNLCTNAAQAMKENGGVLSIDLELAEIDEKIRVANSSLRQGKFWKLIFSDTGRGMSPEVKARIFEPFFTTKNVGEGTGMGLAAVHGIVKDHGGVITVWSELGKGARFEVFLPAVEVSSNQFISVEAPVKRGRGRVLLVDDEKVLVKLGTQMLERLGYEVIGMQSSQDALEEFSKAPFSFDLVITDQTMPKMPGDVFGQKLMKVRPDIPIILCSGYSGRISSEHILKLGFKDYLPKPVSFVKLGRAVAQALNKK